MAEGKIQDSINTTELLMNISKDVAVIKNDMQHLKDDAKERDESVGKRLSALEESVASLQDKDDKEYASRYKKALAFTLTAFGGMLTAKLSDIIVAIVNVFRG